MHNAEKVEVAVPVVSYLMSYLLSFAPYVEYSYIILSVRLIQATLDATQLL